MVKLFKLHSTDYNLVMLMSTTINCKVIFREICGVTTLTINNRYENTCTKEKTRINREKSDEIYGRIYPNSIQKRIKNIKESYEKLIN